MPARELAAFLGPVPHGAISWTKQRGPDFDVYYGHANPPLSGGVGFYLGGWPDFHPDAGSTLVPGRLGIYPVQWHRKVAADGSITQKALIRMDDYWRADVWASAKRQEDLDHVLAIVAKLPTFTMKPQPLGPQRPNHAMQPTTGRRTTKISMTRTLPPAARRAPASGG
jgi:hypothetical protein